MDFGLTDDQQAIVDGVTAAISRFGDDYWLERDREGGFPHEFYRTVADGGWLGIAMPEDCGGAGLGVMLVEEGGADGEAGGGSPSSSAKLQLIGALRRGKCSGAAAATGWEGRIGGARGRLGRIRLLWFDPAEPAVRGVRVGLSRR